MKKIYKLKTMLLIALLSLVGVSVNAEEVVFKTLDFSKATKEWYQLTTKIGKLR